MSNRRCKRWYGAWQVVALFPLFIQAIREYYYIAIFARVLENKFSDTSSLDYPPLRFHQPKGLYICYLSGNAQSCRGESRFARKASLVYRWLFETSRDRPSHRFAELSQSESLIDFASCINPQGLHKIAALYIKTRLPTGQPRTFLVILF